MGHGATGGEPVSDRWVYDFDDPLPEGLEARRLLGGKGASLKQMTLAGLHVPPGFTISTECCQQYYAQGRQWPPGLEPQVREHLQRLEQKTGRRFGAGPRVLLVSVRSGAAESMPGMMDTLLNCGLHPGLASVMGDGAAFWGLYTQFIRMFARTVHGIEHEAFAPAGADAHAHLRLYEHRVGKPFPTDPWALLAECINAVFDSWQSERAVAYRQRHDMTHLTGTAVNVQMMFPSQVSGIVFTQDPNDHAAGRMVIEASYGLGEAVVSGDVTPDRFLVRREDFSIISADIGHKASVVLAEGQPVQMDPDGPSLSAEQLRQLAELCLRIEKHVGRPLDIEWGWAAGEFALLQSRPIRGLDVAEDVELARQQEINRLRAMCEGRRVWITHNLAETLRFPTPLTWDIVRQFMAGDGGFGRMYRQLGYRPSETVCREGFLELIGGRIYADPDRLAQLFWDGMPLTYDLDQVQAAGAAALDRAPTRFDPNRADTRFLAQLPANLLAMWRAGRSTRKARADARRRFEEQVLPPYLRYVRENRTLDLSGLSDAQVIEELHARRRAVLDEFAPEALLPGFFAGIALDAVQSLLSQLMGERNGAMWATTLTRGLEGDTTFEQDSLLYDVAQGRAKLQQFLDRFGHRCIGEMELSEPRWRENPQYLHQMIGRMKAANGRNPAAVHHENVLKRQEAQEQLPDLLKQWGGSSLRERLEHDLADAQALLPYRESGKHYLMMGYELLRVAIEELSRRWELGRRIYFLHCDELSRFTAQRAQLTETIAKRRVRWQALQRLDMPDVIDSEHLHDLGRARVLKGADEMTATTLAGGVATGAARIVFDPTQAGDLGTDYVLVCPSTDPGWTPLFLHARGLIVERGGVLSHGAIVARDFGIPAVVLPSATRLLKSGDRVRVDGNTGKVVVIGREQRVEGPHA